MLTLLLALLPAALCCVSPLDCNGRECLDCSCTNGACVCADGWSGSTCETPFCSNRTTCSNHGSCVEKVTSITCLCDDGYTGAHCETAICKLQCLHDGSPDSTCTKCTNCAGAWYGPTCNLWDSSVSSTTLTNEVNSIFNTAVAAVVNMKKNYNPIPGFYGYGADSIDFSLKEIPVLRLSFLNPKAIWQGYRTPDEVDFVGVSNPQEQCIQPEVFPDPGTFYAASQNLHALNTGQNGLFAQTDAQILSKFNGGSNDVALSLARMQYVVYQMNVDMSKGLVMEKQAQRALMSMPPYYDTAVNKALWRLFFEKFGSSFATNSYVGGAVEMVTSWDTTQTDLNYLQTQAAADFYSLTKCCYSSTALNADYVKKRSYAYTKYGGDPTVSDVNNWLSSIPTDPTQVYFKLESISELISDPTVKAAFQAAEKAYVAEQNAAWAETNLCPTCNGHGSCAVPHDTCTCTKSSRDSFIGRQCSACAPGFLRYPLCYGSTTASLSVKLRDSCWSTKSSSYTGTIAYGSSIYTEISAYRCRPAHAPYSGVFKTTCIVDGSGNMHVSGTFFKDEKDGKDGGSNTFTCNGPTVSLFTISGCSDSYGTYTCVGPH